MTQAGHVIKYANPFFDESAMDRKVKKNLANGMNYQTLYSELKKERELCLAFSGDALHMSRALELLDQMLFMWDNQSLYGASLEGSF